MQITILGNEVAKGSLRIENGMIAGINTSRTINIACPLPGASAIRPHAQTSNSIMTTSSTKNL